MEKDLLIGQVSRRRFLGTAATAAAFSALPLAPSGLSNLALGAVARAKPNSKFNGVQIGTITYSFRNLDPGIEGVLKACVEANCSSIELMSNGIEDWCGAPKAPARGRGPGPGGAPPDARGAVPPQGAGTPPQAARGETPPRGGRQPLTPEQQAAQDKYNAEIKAWRLAAPMEKFIQLRKMFNDAGVNIHIVKWSPARWSDEEIDYAFKAAKALGAKGVCDEIGDEACKRLGPFAEKHGMYAIFHQHGQPADPNFSFDKFLTYSPAIMLNFDAGHYFGCTGLHPNGIIERLHSRIISVHLKDKTGPKSTPPDTNQVWGKGEMPIADVLKLIQKNRWPIYCDIELEYNVPADSDAAREVAKCVQFAKAILTK